MNEIRQDYDDGATIYALIREHDGDVWNPVAVGFEAFGTGSRTSDDYDFPLTAKPPSKYVADFPKAIPSGVYDVQAFLQAGANPVLADDVLIGATELTWNADEQAVEAETVIVASGRLDVFNLAILEMGGADEVQLLESATEEGDVADALRAAFPFARGKYIEDVRPVRCHKYAELTLTGDTVEAADWDYVFDLPSDFVAIGDQLDELDHNSICLDWEITESYFCTDTYSNADRDAAFISYYFEQSDVSLFTSNGKIAIAKMLCYMVINSVTKKPNDVLRARMLEEYEYLTKTTAQATNQRLRQGRSKRKGRSKWLDARKGVLR